MFSADNDVVFESLDTMGVVVQSDWLRYAPVPRADASKTSGTSLVVQMLESLLFKTRCFGKISDETVRKIFAEASCAEDIRLGRECAYPSLKSIVKTVLDQGLVKNCNAVWAKDIETLSHYNNACSPSIVELKLTTSTMNAHHYFIEEEGELVSEDYTKGFLLVCMSEDTCILQNTLGLDCGLHGFNMIDTELLRKLFVKGVALELKKPESENE